MKPAQCERLVHALISLLEQGTVPWRREWDPVSSGHHVNLRSGRRYRGVNPILLTLGMHQRGSQLPYWCGWGEARSLGLSPRQGSHAVMVLRPQRHQGQKRAGSAAASPADALDCGAGADERALPPELHAWVSYCPVPVFNAADLVGDALPALVQRRQARAQVARRSEPERLAGAEAVLASWPAAITHGGERACYLPACDRIVLPPRCAFHSAGAYYATWAHEVVHSSGHSSRLGRDLSGLPSSDSYAREELIAELGSVLIGDRLEIGSDLANHASYLSSWISQLRERPPLLLQVLSDARRAADLIAPEQPDSARAEPGHGESDPCRESR